MKLELGNSTPVIVAADADVDAAAAKLAANAFAFAGQSCISVQRIYVERPCSTRSSQAFVPKVEALKVGDPADDDTDVGPVIDDGRARRASSSGSRRRARPARSCSPAASDGELIRPTVLADVADDAKVSCEEVFGPVVVVNAVDSRRRGDRARQRHTLRPPGRHLHRLARHGARARPTGSSSAA